MRTFMAALALSLVAGAAVAGEGNGDPFAFAAPGITTSLQNYKQAAGVSQNPYPFTAPGLVQGQNNVLPSNGSNGVVQTANSLPRGFADGVPGQANLDHQILAPNWMVQRGVATAGPRG